ncbi:MAG TPA: DinB family protein [Actinomycetota bacterium]|nr:DinB family protein [Actinomycetota bacterium]
MNTSDPLLDWIRDEYRWVRSMIERDVLKGLSSEEIKTQLPTGNSIAWVMWHLARIEDMAVTSVIRREPQVFLSFGSRLGTKQTGTGNSFGDEELAELTDSLDVVVLLEYWREIGVGTRDWLGSVTLEELTKPISFEELAKVFPEGVVGIPSYSVRDWDGKPPAYLLKWPVILHGYIHIGEMVTIRGSLPKTD